MTERDSSHGSARSAQPGLKSRTEEHILLSRGPNAQSPIWVSALVVSSLPLSTPGHCPPATPCYFISGEPPALQGTYLLWISLLPLTDNILETEAVVDSFLHLPAELILDRGM